MKGLTKRQLTLAVVLACTAPAASAFVNVDGKFDGIGSGAYSTIVGLSVDGVDGGFLALGEDGAGQYLYFSNPLGFVDNSYGTGATGWSGGHKFDQLVSSDNARFDFAPNDGSGDVKIDYIEPKTKDSVPNSVFHSNGLSKSGSGTFDSLTGFATSLEFNLQTYADTDLQINSPNTAGQGGTSSDPADYVLSDTPDGSSCSGAACGTNFPDWIFEVGYELKFDTGTFDSEVFNNQTVLATNFVGDTVRNSSGTAIFSILEGHASPSKTGHNAGSIELCDPAVDANCDVPPGTPPPPTSVPEPGMLSLLGLGLAALGFRRRRRVVATTV